MSETTIGMSSVPLRSSTSSDPEGEVTVVGLWAHTVSRYGTRVALTDGGTDITYESLERQADRVARLLLEAGVRRGDLVALVLGRGIRQAVCMLAVLKVGAAYVPIEPDQPMARTSYILEDARPRLILSEGSCEGSIPFDARPPVVLMDAAAASLEANGGVAAAPQVSGEDLAYVIYTSGSTGHPKGVMVTHENVTRLFTAASDAFQFSEADVCPLFHSYAFDFSTWELWGALLHGGRAVVVRSEIARSPEDMIELMQQEGVTLLCQTPSAFRGLAEHVVGRSIRPAALRSVVFGGEALDIADVSAWLMAPSTSHIELINMYGITEITVHATHHKITPSDLRTPTGRSPIGVPLADLVIRVADDSGALLAPGATGEMLVGGAGVARGYLNRPRLTAERFVPDPFSSEPGRRLYRSGDLARELALGELDFRGRLDDQLKIRGHRIEPGEVEHALLGHPSVTAAAVIADRAGGVPGARLVAYVQLRDGLEADFQGLRHALAQQLPDYMLPAVWRQVDVMPLTTNGKIDKDRLPALVASAPSVDSPPPDTPFGDVASVFAEVLGMSREDIPDEDERFYDLGGDSILAITASNAFASRGMEVSVRQMLTNPSLREVALAVADRHAPKADPSSEVPDLLRPRDRALIPDDGIVAYPLTGLQAAMIDRYLTSDVYANSTMYRVVDASFDVVRLEEALAEVVARFDPLRTAINITDYSEPLALVLPAAEHRPRIRYLDLRSSQQFDADLNALFRKERSERFDLDEPPLLRVTVVRESDDTHRIVITELHAILDGLSYSRVVDELFDLYKGRATAGQSRNDAAFMLMTVASQRSATASAEARAFWRGKLRDRAHAFKPDLERRLSAGTPHDVREDLDLTARRSVVQAAAAQAGVSVKSVLLAAYVDTLFRVSELDPANQVIATGVVVNLRPEVAGGDQAAGMFLNSVPLVVSGRTGSWIDFIRSIADAEQELWPYRGVPLGTVLGWSATRQMPTSLFNYINLPSRHPDVAEEATNHPNDSPISVTASPGCLIVELASDTVAHDLAAAITHGYELSLDQLEQELAGEQQPDEAELASGQG
jgi:amino acid adenylation domain-containing protein